MSRFEQSTLVSIANFVELLVIFRLPRWFQRSQSEKIFRNELECPNCLDVLAKELEIRSVEQVLLQRCSVKRVNFIEIIHHFKIILKPKIIVFKLDLVREKIF